MDCKTPISRLRIQKVENSLRQHEEASASRDFVFSLGSPALLVSAAVLAFLVALLENLAYAALVPQFLPEAGRALHLFPNVAAPLLLGLLYGSATAIFVGLAAASIVWVLAGLNPCTIAVALTSAVYMAIYTRRVRNFRGIFAIVSNQLLAQCLFGIGMMCWLKYGLDDKRITSHYVIAQFISLALFSIMECPLALYAILPLAEKRTHRVSDFSLSRFDDLGNELMRRLAKAAPGTYGHSQTVADLADAAADAIGANGLLARIGGYWHDVGKLSNPKYYMENQQELGNPHDSLSPSMSKMIIAAHVKEGAILARGAGLPDPVVRIIETHHGTSDMQWFKLKAEKEAGADIGRNGAATADGFFRYGGPLPETREETIVSLADSMEAASRSLPSPTVADLAAKVDEIVEARFADGQFARSALTLAELDEVKRSFVSTLTHARHARKAYPPKM